MEFDKNAKTYASQVERQGGEDILYINYIRAPEFPSLADSGEVMEKTIDALIENPNVSRIVFVQNKNYNYDLQETNLLLEIAHLYVYFLRQEKILSINKLVTNSNCQRFFNKRYNDLFSFLFFLKKDPLIAYFDIKKFIVESRIFLNKIPENCKPDQENYLRILEEIKNKLESTSLISKLRPHLNEYSRGDREIYQRIFKPDVIPNFTFTRIVEEVPSPKDAELIDEYKIYSDENDVSRVSIFKKKNEAKLVYHLEPPENSLDEEKSELLNLARGVLIEHQPRAEEFTDTERTRQVFFNISKDLLQDLASARNINLSYKDLNLLSKILVRHTIGFGLIEILLQDNNLQDIVLNAPIPRTNIFVRHGTYDECSTNILPSQEDADSWAAKFRMLSGRPLDEANPILDTQVTIGNLRARVATIQNPLSPDGIAYAFRRHRENPWTLPLFIKYKMLNPLAAGLLSFIVDGSRTMLVAGTRSSGKTSLMGSLMQEIIPRYRVIVVEDSLELPVESLRRLKYDILSMKVRSSLLKTTTEVSAEEGIRTSLRLGDSCLIVGEVRSSLRGDQEVIIIEDGITKRIPIRDIQYKDYKNILVPTLSSKNKMEIRPLTGFVKHPKRKELLKIKTKSGREVVVTPDHSVFTNVNFKIAAINSDKLKKGDPLIIPSKINSGFNDKDYLNLLEILGDNYRLKGAEKYLRRAIKILGWKKASKLCGVSDIYRYLLSTQKTRIPINNFLKLMKEANISYKLEDLEVKKGTSHSIPAKFPLNKNILRLIGYYLAEGNIDKDKIQITNSKQKIIKDIKEICLKELDLKVSQRDTNGLGGSVQMYLKSRPLRDLLIYLGCGKTSFYKRIPSFVYGLSEEKICNLLRGMYSGDGSFSASKSCGNSLRYFSTSKKLVEDVAYALLSLGIVARIHSRKSKINGHKECFVAEIKQRKYIEEFFKRVGFTHKKPEIFKNSFAHTKDDFVEFNKKELEKHLILPRKYRHLKRFERCSKEYLKKITEEVKCSNEIYDFAHGDFFIDRIKSIEKIELNKPEYVYDLSVASTERFIGGFGGILLHNTEARALYEAMRVGALANFVAGTIHGASPYGVFDRVVNDLGVEATSFKATDIIVVANVIKSPDGLESYRRIVQITEVRKHWNKDPLDEGGFVDLMKYDVEEDELKPTEDLINGESEILKGIAGNVKGWAGNWDAVWDNILLRGEVKKEIKEMSEKENLPELLEADFNVLSNDAFHKISESVRKKSTEGLPLKEKVFPEWKKWLEEEIKVLKKK